jgi:Ca2+-binding RTX toxin-like protein
LLLALFGIVIVNPFAGHASAATVSVGPSHDSGLDAVIYVAAPGETNDVTIEEDGASGDLVIVDEGATINVGPGCTSVAPDEATCTYSHARFEVRLDDGNDTVAVGDAGFEDAVLEGGEGNDEIRAAGGDFSFANLEGGPGNDMLRGGRGSDRIDGGPGADFMSGGDSTSCGTAGICSEDIDTVTYANRTADVFVDADGMADDGEALEGDLVRPNFEHVVGGSGDDVLAGHPTMSFFAFEPVLIGTKVSGRAGSDKLLGGRAADELVGGGGSDTLRGKARRDQLFGGGGEDRVYGGRGRDWLSGGDGGDLLFARDGQRDRVGGGSGLDVARTDPLDRLRGVEAIFL